MAKPIALKIVPKLKPGALVTSCPLTIFVTGV
jgi:hypothetical protein